MGKNKAPAHDTLRDDCKVLMTPNFYKEFKCIGADCENNCCHHWNVTMDKPTFDVLSNIGDIEVRQVMNNQTRPCGEHRQFYRAFTLTSQGNCPFLQDDGWCYLHKNHGEKVLPQICKIYPRDNKLIDGTLYHSLSISCPEAARKILLDPAAMSIDQVDVTPSTDLPNFIQMLFVKDEPLHQLFKQVAYQCVVGSETDSLEQRLFKLAVLFDVTSQRILKGGDVAPLLYQLQRSLMSGELDKMYEQGPVTENVQMYVLQQVLYEKRFSATNATFMQYKQKAIEQIKLSEIYDAQNDTADLSGFHQRFCQKGYEQLIETHGHVFLNLMLHWVYSKAFNMQDGENLYTQFANFAIKFFYVRTLCGMLCEQDPEENSKLLVGIIHSISRASDHDKVLAGEIYKKLCQEELGQHEHILGLIKV